MNGHDKDDLPLAQPLTPREQEILNCIGDGLTNRQMAQRLTIAAGTVKWYVRQVYNKLGVSDRAAAVARAQRLRLLPLEELEEDVRNNLPLAATPFVGREEELAALARLIADSQVRIITLIGPGGIGKTRLALEAAGCELRSGSQFPDGVFFVSLAAIESADEIVPTLASVLDFQFQGSGIETEQLLNYLRQKQMLLVMDNFEHILDGRAMLAEINKQAAGITLLVTSRERLQLRGEQLFPLQGLEMAESEVSSTESPATQLFLNIAKRISPAFELLEEDAEHLLHICRLVEGMPLGLELAASWAGMLPLSEIAADIKRGLDLLATDHQDVPQRQQSMKATLDASWRRLTPEQQRALQELTAFRGGFTRPAALEIAEAALPLLVTLVNKSWLSYDRQKDRYHIHELLRQYGAGKLNVGPVHEQDVRERHSAFFCGYLQEREADWFGPRQKETASEVRDEIDNIQHAWRLAASQGDSVLMAQGLNSLCRFYLWEGRMNDGRNACRSAGEGLEDWLAEQHTPDAQCLTLWSRVLVWESEFIYDVTNRKDLLARSQRLLERAAQSGYETRPEQAFIFLAKADRDLSPDPDEIMRFANQSLELYRELGDRWGEAEALKVLGGIYLHRGAPDRASDLLHKSAEIRDQLGDSLGLAETMVFLGFGARFQGSFKESEALLRQSLQLFRRLGNHWGTSYCLGILSYTLSWAGEYYAAQEAAGQMIKTKGDLGQILHPWQLNASIVAAIHLGRYHEAQASAAESLTLAQQIDHLDAKSWALMYLGEIAFVQEDVVTARRYLQQSAAMMAELLQNYKALPNAIVSYVLRAQDDGNLARGRLVRALQMGMDQHSFASLMCCLPVAALLLADDGKRRRAVELYSLALQFGHIANSRWFADIACRELDEVRASLPADVAAAAEARGRELDVWQTAEALLNELQTRIISQNIRENDDN